MIYKINNIDLSDVLVNGGRLVVFSFDGKYAIVSSEKTLSYALDAYDEAEITQLFEDPLYKQPCKDC